MNDGKLPGNRRLLEHRAPGLDGGQQVRFRGIDARSGRRPLRGRQRAQGLELLREGALATQPVHPQFLERGKAVAGADLHQRLRGQRGQISHERRPGPDQAANAALACAAMTPKAFSSWIARSDSSLRSISMPASRRPAIRRL